MRFGHPDAHLDSYNPDCAWCEHCAMPVRVGGRAWYGAGGTGPFCSVKCMRGARAQGTLPDHVEELAPVLQFPVPDVPVVGEIDTSDL